MSRAPKAEQRKKERERERKKERKKERKDLGKKCVCEPGGDATVAPAKKKRLLGPCGPKRILATKKNQTGGGLNPSAREGRSTPLPSLRQGERARPPAGRPSCEQAQGPLETCEPQTGKNNRQKKKGTNASTASRPKRASEQSRENPKTARGPEWHPEETPEQKGRTAKTGETKQSGGEKNKKNNSKCGGVSCPVRPELYLLNEKEKKEKQHTRRRQPTP